MVTWWLLIGTLSFTILAEDVLACSCIYSHPQEHYCSADFVAVVRVKSPGKGDGSSTAYHVKVKKEFKVSDKARHALSQGLLWTSSHSSSCGVSLKQTRYLVAGRISGEKPFVSICHFVEEWSKLSHKQKKGFRKLYQQGCHCRARMTSYVRRYGHLNQHSDRLCSWETVQGKQDCQGLFSMCVPSPHNSNHCDWVNNTQYKRCMKDRKLEKKRLRDMEP